MLYNYYMAAFRKMLRYTYLAFIESLRSFDRNNDFKTAAALAFYGLFALIPLMLLIFYLLGNYIVSSQTALRGLDRLVANLFPEFSRVIFREVYSLSMSSGIWGTIYTIALFWAIYPLVSALRDAFFMIFRCGSRAPYLMEKVLDVIAVLIILILFIFLIISEIIYSKVIVALLEHLPVVLSVINHVAPLFITTAFLMIFYFVFSPIKLKLSHLLAGSFAGAILWTAIRPAFTLFLTFNPQYGFAFGSLKAIFFVLLWVYYSFFVILFGAEIIAVLEQRTGRYLPAR